MCSLSQRDCTVVTALAFRWPNQILSPAPQIAPQIPYRVIPENRLKISPENTWVYKTQPTNQQKQTKIYTSTHKNYIIREIKIKITLIKIILIKMENTCSCSQCSPLNTCILFVFLCLPMFTMEKPIFSFEHEPCSFSPLTSFFIIFNKNYLA